MASFQTEQFGKYLLLDKIGLGGMAEVYIGKMTGDEGFEKLLVIKKMLPHLTDEDELVKSFIDEAKVAALLQHENIICIYDFGKINDSYFIAMEHLFGKDLKQVIKKSIETGAQIDLENILYIVSRVCDGLDYAHNLKNLQGEALNIIHRDISPQNIFVTYDGHIKIIDFGIAKTALQDTRTQIGFVKGKLAYMSPEQAGNEAIDSRSDIFAVGIILYEMVTGRRMFKGETSEIYPLVLKADFEPPENIVPGLPTKLIEILYKSLAKDPDNRYQSCDEMLSDLEDCLDELSSRPNSRKMSQVMTALFEKELDVEKNHILEELKYCEPQKTEPIVNLQTSNGRPDKTVVLNTNIEADAPENQTDIVKEKEQTEEYFTDEKPPPPEIKTRKNWRRKTLVILLCVIGILLAVGYAARYKYNIVQTAIIIKDEGETTNTDNINKFLTLAKESLTNDELTTPPDASAYYFYNEVLKLDPENILAKKGLGEIANRYALLAEEKIKKIKYEKTKQYIEKGLMISPDHPQLLRLEEIASTNVDNINNFLMLAKESLAEYRLTTPSENSAYYYYNEVLKLDPENIMAKQGFVEIANRYALLAEEQIKNLKYEKANQYIERGLMISPDHHKLLSLKEAANPNLPKKVINSIKSIFK